MPSEQPEERPLFVVTLQPQPGVDGVHALRGALKTALRRFGLKAVSAYVASPQNQDDPTAAGTG